MHCTIARFLAVAATARGLAVPSDKAAPPAPPGDQNAQVWVCSNKWCRERGAALPLGAALGLSAGADVDVKPHSCFGRCGDGPNVCAVRGDTVLEFHRVDSVEKVCRILGGHLDVAVDRVAAKCLELNFQANAAHERGDLELAVRLYTDALATGHEEQRGVLLAGRAGCFLELAARHATSAVALAAEKAAKRALEPSTRARRVLLAAASTETLGGTPAALAVLRSHAANLAADPLRAAMEHDEALSGLEAKRALRDAARAAEALPSYARTWTRLADALAALGRSDDAAYFGRVAAALDAGAVAASR